MVIRKSPREIDRMAAAGAIVAQTLALLRDAARPGVTTGELDAQAEFFIRGAGGVPTFKGYQGFPGSICSSPNAMIVHGIPGAYELRDGDVLSLDVGVTYRGWVADSALTVPVGSVTDEALRLLETCRLSLFDAAEQCRPGRHLSDIGHAVQQRVEGAGFGVVRKLVGHGVGRRMHEDPQIPNYGPPDRGIELRDGMVFAIEPMITAGSYEIELDDEDGWSIFTADGSLSAHFEHTIAVTRDVPRIVTRDQGWSPVDDAVVVAHA
jgi:methionyl aminopeptidase